MSGCEKPGQGSAIEALPEETGSQRLCATYHRGARVRLYRHRPSWAQLGVQKLPGVGVNLDGGVAQKSRSAVLAGSVGQH
jgi:hypothetical protein